MSIQTFDVAVVGAGPGGAAAAYYLAKQGLKVLLLDKQAFPRDKTCGDALSSRALDVLAEMGLLPALNELGYRVNEFEIFAPKGHSVVSPIPHRDGAPPYVLILPRLQLDYLILQQAQAVGAVFEGGVEISELSFGEAGNVVRGFQSGQPVSYRARCVIIATGATTGLLRRVGLLKKPPKMMLAARGYYKNIQALNDRPPDRVYLYYNHLPLPGFGWVFPTSATTANVGLGLCPVGLASLWLHAKPRPTFARFSQSPPLQAWLAEAQAVGPLKSYPIRTDFTSAPTFGPNTLMVGEAAGLVNPLSGEGIDYALESGRLAAAQIIAMFAANDFSRERLADYDRLLRQQFQRQFLFCDRARDWFVNPLFLNRMVTLANRHLELRQLFTGIVLGSQPVQKDLSAATILKLAGYALNLRQQTT